MTAVLSGWSRRIRWYHIAALFAAQTVALLVNRFVFLPAVEVNLRGLQIFQRMTAGYTGDDARQILAQLDAPARSLYLRAWLPLNLAMILLACAVFALIFIKAWPRFAVWFGIPVALYLAAGVAETFLVRDMLRAGTASDGLAAFCSFVTRARYFLGDNALYVLAMISVSALIIPFFADRRKGRRAGS